MKKIAIAYRGIFNYQKYSKEGLTKNLLNDIEKNIDNHRSMLYTCFGECEIDFFFSTYDLEKEIKEVYEKNLNFKYYGYVPKMVGDGSGWKLHLIHSKNLITEIKSHIEISRTPYDFLVFTRPDIKLLKNIDYFNLDLSKFNIVLKHLSGNCDDNLWIFPIKFLDMFEESIDTLKNENYRITHEINHELEKRNVEINYMTVYKPYPMPDGTDMGHKVFEFFR